MEEYLNLDLSCGIPAERGEAVLKDLLTVSGFEIFAFPNPASEYVHLKIISQVPGRKGEIRQDFSFQLYDVNGKMLMNKRIKGPETDIRIAGFVPSTCYLRVI